MFDLELFKPMFCNLSFDSRCKFRLNDRSDGNAYYETKFEYNGTLTESKAEFDDETRTLSITTVSEAKYTGSNSTETCKYSFTIPDDADENTFELFDDDTCIRVTLKKKEEQ